MTSRAARWLLQKHLRLTSKVNLISADSEKSSDKEKLKVRPGVA